MSENQENVVDNSPLITVDSDGQAISVKVKSGTTSFEAIGALEVAILLLKNTFTKTNSVEQ